MSLDKIWKESPTQILGKRVDQIIGFAGDGKLGDKNSAPAEFRAFLKRVPVDVLERYADECLTQSFTDSGLALQDIVNEMAERLGFDVDPGRYRGTKNAIGYDGIWTGPDGHAVIAEVKTTDAYQIRIKTVAGYRRDLVKSGRIDKDSSSVLIIVGRQTTGELEAQIRGSHDAWDVRVISVDALIRLVKIRQEIDEPRAEAKIRSLLVPREYTRVDEIIDLVFSTTEDLLDEVPSEVDEGELLGEGAEKKRVAPVSFNGACAARISEHHGWDLIKQSRIAYADPGQNLTVTCSVSKEYPHPTGTGYWFAFHTHQLEKLREAGSGYAAFGCGSPDQIALFPIDFLESQLDGLNQTHRADGRSYWHVLIHCNEGKWCLKDKRVQGWTDISTRMVFNRGKPA